MCHQHAEHTQTSHFSPRNDSHFKNIVMVTQKVRMGCFYGHARDSWTLVTYFFTWGGDWNEVKNERVESYSS